MAEGERRMKQEAAITTFLNWHKQLDTMIAALDKPQRKE